MNWAHETVLNPVAWTVRVENDLRAQLVASHRDAGEQFDDDGHAALDAAFAAAREQLADRTGPQRVTLHADGTANVIPVEVEPDDVREARHVEEANARITAQREALAREAAVTVPDNVLVNEVVQRGLVNVLRQETPDGD